MPKNLRGGTYIGMSLMIALSLLKKIINHVDSHLLLPGVSTNYTSK